MRDRIQRALDGDLSIEELSSVERAEMETWRWRIAAVVRAQPDRPLPNLAPAVLHRIAATSPHRPHRAPRLLGIRDWLWMPRPIAIRPALAIAAVAALVALVLLRPASPSEPAPPSLVLVHFRLAAPEASDVRLAGDFTEWQPAHVLTRGPDGIWSVVIPLTPGVHEYGFVIDGTRWTPDPSAPSVEDGFGGRNSRVAVLAPEVGL